MGALKASPPKDNKYIEAKNNLVNNVENFYNGREKIIEGFKNGAFPFYYDERHEHQMKAQREIEEEEQTKQDKKLLDPDEVIEWMINRERAPINNELFKKHFKIQKPIDMYKVLRGTKDKEKNSKLVNMFNSALKDLKKEIGKMSKKQKKIEKPNNIVKVVERILELNKQNQQGKGLKILTPNQILSRLPIALAQLQAGNNSEKLKNEIRQLLYSLYRLKNMTKQVYNNLIKYIGIK